MTIQEAYKQLLYKLFEIYDDREAANICDWVIEHITGLKKIDRITRKNFLLNDEQKKLLENYTNELLPGKPVQYILHEAWFAGMKLYLDGSVLIPRPETEELVNWIIADCNLQIVNSILDIGTGSGCIPVALKKKLPSCEITAMDISEKALEVAKQNAAECKTEIHFHQCDILNKEEWKQFSGFDIIVSNPPYIKQSEANEMRENVLQYEPHIALFVPDSDALLFYKTITEFGLQHLNKNGKLFFEINETQGENISNLLAQCGYINIEIKKDMQGKDRMIKATLPVKYQQPN